MRKIVAIDDDFQVLNRMKTSIPWADWGFDWVGEALDGKEGLKLVREMGPDVVISDIYMPDMTGLDMIEHLRSEGYEGEIVILSGYNDFEYARQAMRMQVNDYLSKPISMEELGRVMKNILLKLEEKVEEKVEREELSRKLHQYEPFVMKEWVKSLVTGTSDHLVQLPQSIDPAKWQGRGMLVLGIELKRTDKLLTSSLIDWNLFRFAIGNIVQEIIKDQWHESYYIEMHSYHSAVLLLAEWGEQTETTLVKATELARVIIHCIEIYMKLKVDIGIGSVTTDFSTLHLSTEEAFRALLFLKHQNHEPGVYLANSHSDLNKTAEEQHPPIRALYYFHRMAQTLLIDQKADALADVEQFISILSNRSFTNQQLRSLATEFWSVIGFTFYTTSPNKGNGFEEAFRDTHIETIDSLGQLCDWMCNLVTMVSDSRSVNGNLKHNPAVEVMLQHIHEHYYEEFTLEDLSAKLYLTPNYLSRIFKQATGETFNIYLVRVRIEKAKALLLEGKLMIYEIATKVGYKNIPYFSSLFKKFTGVNPREFAKLGR